MFGTLVIQLPSHYSGGELIVYHRSKSECFDFSGAESCADFYYAAFYADCQHEIKPVTKGFRLCLIYNLIYHSVDCCPTPENNEESVSTIVSAMKQWSKDVNSINQHPMIAFLLEHQYCEASLSFESLKNGDRAVADVLTHAQEEESFDMFVANIRVNQNWSASHRYSYCSTHNYFAEDFIDEEFSANNLVDVDDKTIPKIDIDSNYVVPEDFFDDMEPDEESFEEATGNEGATLDKQYNWAALLFWPSGHRLKNIGITSSIHLLKQHLNDTIDEHGKSELEIWVKSLIHACGAPENDILYEDYISLLQIVKKFGKVEMIAELLQVVSMALSNHSDLVGSPSFSNEIIAIGNDHGWNMLAPPLQAIFNKLSASSCKIEKYFQFIRAIMQPSSPQRDLCIGLASSIVSALVDEADRKPSTTYSSYYSSDIRSKEFFAKLFDCLVALACNNQLLSLVYGICAKSNRYPVREFLVPLCEKLSCNHRLAENIAYTQLVSFCIASLEASSSRTIPSPSNWSEPVKFSCSCTDCSSLMKFLRHPTRKQERYKVNQSIRYHLDQQLDKYGCSVTHTTERVGSPHTLVITKTRAKYEKNCQILKQEKTMLSRLQALKSPQGPAEKRMKID